MNTTHDLLFHLDIPLTFFAKLHKFYYYIPENKVATLKLGGFVYVVNHKLNAVEKQLQYAGILVAVNATQMTCRGLGNLTHANVHIFYRPPKVAIHSAFNLLTHLN